MEIKDIYTETGVDDQISDRCLQKGREKKKTSRLYHCRGLKSKRRIDFLFFLLSLSLSLFLRKRIDRFYSSISPLFRYSVLSNDLYLFQNTTTYS